MVVLRLADFSNKETVSALRCLLADASSGRITGLALCFKTRDGSEHAAFTGAYKARPSEAAAAALRLSWRLTQATDPDPP